MKKFTVLLAIFLLFLPFFSACGDAAGNDIVLLPKDADLTFAPQVIVEPDEEPYNLGGWPDYNEVSWNVKIETDGMYNFLILYSRPGNYPEVWGELIIHYADGDGNEDDILMKFKARPTGSTDKNEDWSVYEINDGCAAELRAGEISVSIRPYVDFGAEDRPEYFINLRSLTLRPSKGR